ncbi:M14 family metallopeptidase [Aeoliella sp.]|uniref:M14 family metallopeptidase n=1 Tax=Aeoliella sp. TaxID=2795800 RepID=UPI003CCB75D4
MPTSPRLWTTACLALHLLCASLATSAPVELSGYQAVNQFEAAIRSLGEHDVATVASLGKSAEGREIHLVTLGAGDWANKPAVLVVGSVDASSLVGSELSIRMARQLADRYTEGDEAAVELLDAVTLYFIPRPNPDASAQLLYGPTTDRATNTRATDDDRDGATDEDPVNDLNGDEVITMMRVADPTGPWMQHPDDPRLMVKADAKKNEAGQYRLYSEGTDDDLDDAWNEDGPGGVDFNRNLTFEYPYFQPGAGSHQVSEPETRAVVDWMFTQPNIFLVFSFAPQDNLAKPWSVAKNNGGRIKRQVLPDDGPYFDHIAKMYAKNIGNKNAPTAAEYDGAFAPWAYFHYGRWSLATRGWWIPKVEAAKPDEDKKEEESGESEAAPDEESEADDDKAEDEDKEDEDKEDSKKPDSRNADEVNALAWFEQEGVDGFVDWTEVEHPDFPGKKVEVGGFKPLLRSHPPASELDRLATRHGEFLADAIALRAKLVFGDAKLEALGEDIYRLKATVINQGYLPTASSMGRTSNKLQRLEVEFQMPNGSKLLVGDRRQRLGVLDGNGGSGQATWLVRLPSGVKSLKLRAGEPSVGYTTQTIDMSEATQPKRAKEANVEK